LDTTIKYKKLQSMTYMPKPLQQITIKLPTNIIHTIDNISTERQGRIDRSTTIRELIKERIDQIE